MHQDTLLLLAVGAAVGLLVAISLSENRRAPQELPMPIPEANDETWTWEDWRGRSRTVSITRNIKYRDYY